MTLCVGRRSRSDATKDHIPSVLRIDVTNGGYTRQFVEVPHRPFDEVFHSILVDMATDGPASKFVAGLAELQGRRTESGAGLVAFLEKNLSQFEQPIAAEIMALAQEVTDNG